MAPEAFDLHTPASVLLRLTLLDAGVTSVPLAFTERVRDFSSLPFPFFLRRFRVLLPLSQAFRNIPPHCVPFRTVVKPVLLCAFLHLASLTLTDIRPANIEYDALWSNPPSQLELVRVMLPLSALHTRTLLPTSSSALIGPSAPAFKKTSLGHANLMSIFVSSLKNQCVPMRPFLYPDHGSHTSLLLQALLPVSTSELLESV